MLFNSVEFLLFMAVFFSVWPLVRPRKNVRWIGLVAASYFFYGWWDWRFLFLLTASGLIDFFAGLGMVRRPRWRKALLVASIAGNVGGLAAFKYLDFFLENVNWGLWVFGSEARLPLAHMILPVGISFYTFQSMSYTIDVYRGELRPTRNVFHFFAYLSMFPQLVAGPIVRARQLLPQLAEAREPTAEQRWSGMQLIILGYFKKVVVADNLAVVVDGAFSAAAPAANTAYWWIVMVLFGYQIYCDFSGYSDIARGLGRWMGYEFPVNFDHPYIAGSFREFWTRWHVSLSTWFRDYVYIPLGGSRRGRLRGHLNLWATMLLSGLWHGAAWTFLLWAAVHAAYVSLERLWNWPRKLASLPLGRHLAALAVFALVTLAWVFFRAGSFSQAAGIFSVIFRFTAADGSAMDDLLHLRPVPLLLAGVMILRQVQFHFGWGGASWRRAGLVRAAQPAVMAVLVVACVYLRGPGKAFIYFQF